LQHLDPLRQQSEQLVKKLGESKVSSRSCFFGDWYFDDAGEEVGERRRRVQAFDRRADLLRQVR
jgi:hypothetical protein